MGQIVCDGIHVHGLYVFIYAIYIFHKHICWTWDGKCVKTSLGKWSIMPCHGLGENVKHGADAEFEGNNVCHLYNATHHQESPNCPMSQ